MSDLRAFFDAYGESFTKGAGAIAAFYAEPCMTARAGSVRLNKLDGGWKILLQTMHDR